MLKNIKHLTVTTGNIVTYPDNSVILDIAKPAISAMVNRAKINGFAPVIDNTIVECNINYDLGAYEATLYADKTKKIPLLFTCGTVNECASDYIWDIINNKYHEIYGTCCPKTQIPHAPFICDFIFPFAIFNLGIMAFFIKLFSSLYNSPFSSLEKHGLWLLITI